MTFPLIAVLLACAALACDALAADIVRTNASGSVQGSLVVTPDTIDFGDVQVGLSSYRDITFANTGATALRPILAVTPGALDFGDVGLGGVSAPRTVIVSKTGSGTMRLEPITVAPPFAISGSSCGAHPILVPAGTNCTLAFTFNPAAAGAADALVFFAAVAVPDSFALQLAGTGLEGLGIAVAERQSAVDSVSTFDRCP